MCKKGIVLLFTVLCTWYEAYSYYIYVSEMCTPQVSREELASMACLHPQLTDGGDGLLIRKVAVNVLKKQSRTAD
jgi:hypothetical protein